MNQDDISLVLPLWVTGIMDEPGVYRCITFIKTEHGDGPLFFRSVVEAQTHNDRERERGQKPAAWIGELDTAARVLAVIGEEASAVYFYSTISDTFSVYRAEDYRAMLRRHIATADGQHRHGSRHLPK